MKFINKNTIELDREINELDRFVFDFLKVLEKHSDYVIVSGYVAIILGRNRGTDDVDMIIPKMDKVQLKLLYDDLIKHGFWCINSGDINDLYAILEQDKKSIRFAFEPGFSPNVEIKFAKNEYDLLALKNPVTIKMQNKKFKTSFLELQIAYKEVVLKSNKDMEDAQFLRDIAKGFINEHLIHEYKKMLK